MQMLTKDQINSITRNIHNGDFFRIDAINIYHEEKIIDIIPECTIDQGIGFDTLLIDLENETIHQLKLDGFKLQSSPHPLDCGCTFSS